MATRGIGAINNPYFSTGLEFMNKETDGSGKHFGCLKFSTSPFADGYKKEGKFRIHISLDVSTSMRTDRRIDLAKETIVKMVEYLGSTASENPGLMFWITLTTFSTGARVVINNEKVSSESVSLITSTVNTIQLENSTDFEASFQLDRAIMHEQAEKDKEVGNSDIVTLHIQMTDGEITAGSKDETYLKSILDSSVEHVFIGYGADHKAGCLINLSNVNESSSYMFLDHPTKMGGMFAQIFCPHLFTAVSEVTITLTGAKFLDIENGCETQSMFLARIAADTTKKYHIVTDADEEEEEAAVAATGFYSDDVPSAAAAASASVSSSIYDYSGGVKAVSVKVTFRSFDNQDLEMPPNYPYQKVVDVVSATTHSVEVQKERLRWKVLLLMKDSKNVKQLEGEEPERLDWDHELGPRRYVDQFKAEKDALIQRANELKSEIKEFGEFHDIADDEMLKDLATDVVVCICAIPSREHGLMYIHSRFRSCNDETPTSVTDLTPLDEFVTDFVSSSGFNQGDDQLFSCGGSNEDALHRQRSGTTNAAFDELHRAMSQPMSQQSSGSNGGGPEIRRSNSSYRQSSYRQSSYRQYDDDDNVVVSSGYDNDC
jgi:hypothetical protein